jgi:flagellar basal body-associated protein FliL
MADAKAANPEKPAAAAPPARKRGALLVTGIVLVAIGGAFLTAALVFPTAHAAAPPADDKGAEGTAAQKPTEVETLYELEEVLANIAGAAGTRYLKIEIALLIRSPSDVKVADLLQQRRPVVKDCLITLFSGKTIETVEGRENKEQIRMEIRDELQRLLFSSVKGTIERVFFKSFLSQ